MMFGKGNFCVLSVNRAGRCVNKMLYVILPATLQYIDESDYIAINICVWINERISYPGCAARLITPSNFSFLKINKRVFINYVQRMKRKLFVIYKLFNPIMFQCCIIIIIYVIDTRNIES